MVNEENNNYDDESSLYDDDDIIKNPDNETVKDTSILDSIFSPEVLLYNLEKTLRGYQQENGEWIKKNLPLARGNFISKTINSLRSVVNSQNIASMMTKEQTDTILLEKAKEFTFSVIDEPSIDESDTEFLLNLHDHTLQMFMGLVEGGTGNKTIRQISASLYVKDDLQVKKNQGTGIGWGGKNLIKIGGDE